jgi:FAD:protein FMN transferase
MTKKRLATLVAGLFILTALSVYRLGQTPVTGPPGSLYLQGVTMGTTYSVKVHGTGDPNNLQQKIDETLDAVNAGMSTYREDSELSRFNNTKANTPFTFSHDTYTVFQLAMNIARDSNGAFDLTVGPAVNSYGFGPKFDLDLPADDELEAMRAYVGYQHLRLNDEARTVTKDHDDVYCDLSAIAKGFGVDTVSRLLESRGYENFFVEIGGEVRARGVNDKGQQFWSVGIEKPIHDVREIQAAIPLSNVALATSGNYRNFAEVDGVKISHTIDPSTLKPVTHTLLSASVMHEDCAHADAYATALMVMGPDAGRAFAEDHNVSVMLLVAGDEEGTINTVTSSAWDAAIRAVQDTNGNGFE